MKRLISLLLCLILVFCSATFVSTAADITASGGTATDLGIPLLSMYPVDSTYANARAVWGMAEYEGKIYIGCGNYDSNAGSNLGKKLPVYSYDPVTKEWTKEYEANDEQLSRFFNEWGNLYIAGMDPGANAGEYGNIYYKSNGTWATNSSVYRGIHMFDLLFLEDGKTAFAGLGTNTGVQPYISKSTDGGKTWALVSFKKDGAVITNTSSTWSRTHNMFEYNGEIYGTLWVSSGGNTGNMGLYKYNATDNVMEYYASTPSSLYLNSMTSSYDFTFNDKFVNVYNGVYVFSDDLKSWNYVSGYTGTPTCAQVIGDAVYMTTYSGNTSYLYKTTDLSTFTQMGSVTLADSYIQSFAYLDGTFYMGSRSTGTSSTTNGTVLAFTPTNSGCTHANMVTETDAATCTEAGMQYDSCPDCGYSAETVLEATGHAYTGEWVVETEPTCTETGLERRECANCVDGDTREVAATGHTMPESWIIIRKATCSLAGLKRRTCVNCDVYEQESIPTVDHEFEEEYTVDQVGDCVTPEIKSRHCANCDATTDVITTQGTDHSYEEEYTVDQVGDCTTPEIKSRHCANCDATTDVVTTPAAGHDYVNRVCSVCGDILPREDGDANGDGEINVLDLTIAAQYIAQGGVSGKFDLSACDMSFADLNGDGAIGQVDLNMLARLMTAE